MKKSELKKALLGKNTVLSEESIRRVIEKELEKDADDVDTALLDACFAFLETQQQGKETENKQREKRLTARRILPAAAAAVLLCTIGAVCSFMLSQGQDQIAQDAQSAVSAASASSYLEAQLLSFGISPVTLPAEMISENCTVAQIKDISAESTAEMCIEVQFEYNGAAGKMTVESGAEAHPPDFAAAAGAKSEQTFSINGTDVSVFELESGAAVRYQAGGAVYSIYLDMGIADAVKFAKTIN